MMNENYLFQMLALLYNYVLIGQIADYRILIGFSPLSYLHSVTEKIWRSLSSELVQEFHLDSTIYALSSFLPPGFGLLRISISFHSPMDRVRFVYKLLVESASTFRFKLLVILTR